MSGNPLLKRLLDAGLQFTEMSREQADKLVKEFVRSGQAKRKDREFLVEQLLARGRAVSEGIAVAIQREVGKHLAAVVARLDDVEDRVEELAGRLGAAVARPGAAATSAKGSPTSASPTAGAKKTGAKKTGAKTAGAKTAGAKTAGAKKTGAKKPASKKAGAKKPASKKAGAKTAVSTQRSASAPAKQADGPSAPTAPATSARGAEQA